MKMGMEVTGKLVVAFETKAISDKFSKRDFVIEVADNPKYPQQLLFQLTKDRCEQIDGYMVGDELRVEFNLRGREWRSPSGEVKYFNTLEAWRVEAAGGQQRSRRPAAKQEQESAPVTDDDIPF